MIRSKGFTLIELLVVISIISLLSSVVLASVSTARERAQIAAGQRFQASLYNFLGESPHIYWRFNEGSGLALDSGGTSAHGTISLGSYVSDTPSGKGFAMSLANTGTVSFLPTAGSDISRITDPANGGYTFAGWFKASSDPVGGGEKYLFTRFTSGAIGIFLPQASKTLGFTFGAGGGDSGVRITDGKWHYIVGSVNNTTKRFHIFVDGKQVHEGGYSGNLSAGYNSIPFSVGVNNGWYSFPYIVDDVLFVGKPFK